MQRYYYVLYILDIKLELFSHQINQKVFQFKILK